MNGFKQLVQYTSSDRFTATYGEVFIVPKRINQDSIESFFSVQRQMCGGNRNMTAYTYAFNVNSILSQRSAHLVSRKQTNVHDAYDSAKSLDQLATDVMPKRSNKETCKHILTWSLNSAA